MPGCVALHPKYTRLQQGIVQQGQWLTCSKHFKAGLVSSYSIWHGWLSEPVLMHITIMLADTGYHSNHRVQLVSLAQ